MSLGSVEAHSNSYQQANDMYSRITLVAASGNDAQEYGSYGYPASCNNVISVGAFDVVCKSYYST